MSTATLTVQRYGQGMIRLMGVPPARSLISSDLWGRCVAGDCHPGVLAGEGLFVIRATNGTVRYRLGDYDADAHGYPMTLIAWEPSLETPKAAPSSGGEDEAADCGVKG